jgi:hypothetical protein
MAQIGSIGERLDIILRQGSTLGPFNVTLTDQLGVPINLTGATIAGQVRKNALDTGAPVAVFDIVYTDRIAGKFSFGMTKTVTTLIPAGEYQKDEASQYKWDMELTDSLGRGIPLYYGNFENFREVTRA